jgi:hypothetical protein
MLGFPLQFDATTPRLCKSVLSSASEPAGGSHSGDWFARLRGFFSIDAIVIPRHLRCI